LGLTVSSQTGIAFDLRNIYIGEQNLGLWNNYPKLGLPKGTLILNW
jgi:hypothetical protein